MASVLDSIDEFLSRCQQSGDDAYAALRSVLDRLDDPATRVRARVFLDDIKRRFPTKDDCDRCFSSYHFRIDDIFLDQYEGYHGRKKLSSMVIPSIFIPEDWSFTFFEGLNRHPDSIFKDQTVAELGCGNGWISIAIADKWLPFKVYGLDINPRAVKISWINLYLNALDEKGQPILDSENRTLLDRVEFHESDLLAYCRDNDIQIERIVGCIPQILNPNPDAMSKMITENASEEFLHSLSNYCALQGFVEDQFGLGLIARAVEEGISVIKSTGIMIFNMGGRPGQAVCKRLFERRGFRITKLWQTKILQAADTDISALVEIEKNSPHRFEFFMGLSGDQPICARTAWAYGKAGGRISHALSVYSCQLRQPNQVKTIFDFLKTGFQEISGSLDLSFQDDSVADEKISFLAYLASTFKENAYFPYEPPAGSLRFRSLIAGFMKKYHHIPLNSGNVVVFPSRAVAIENALRLFSPRLAIVDEHLTRHLPRQWLTSLNIETGIDRATDDVRTVIEAPSQSDLMIELIKKLKPQVVVTGMAHFEAVTSSAFVQLLDVTREIGSRLFIDISDHFELSSLPSSNGVLKYLAANSLPSHAAILCGLVKNQVYMDLEVAFVISEEEPILKALSKTVELLEGNTAPISQYYYGCLFHELLSFQLPDRHLPAQRKCDKSASSTDIIGFSSSAISVLNNAELSIDQIENSYLIHMDVDQSFLPTPFPVKAAIFESFSRQNMSESEIDITTSIKQFVKTTYGFPFGIDFTYADSSLTLFNKMVLCCIQEGGTLCFPVGTNGSYVYSAKFLKAKIVNIPTKSEEGFKLTENALNQVLNNVKTPWVYISGPTINPTGRVYDQKEIENLLTTCAKFGARVMIDTSFSGLEFDYEGWGGWNLEGVLSRLYLSSSSFSVCLLGELSSMMLTGALKFGFLALNQLPLIDLFHSFSGLSRPHSTVKYAIKKLLGLREKKSEEMWGAVTRQIKDLRSRSRRLEETLESCGWDVLEPHAGFSMVAKPTLYLNKTTRLKNAIDYEVKLDDSNIRGAILKATGLCINSSSWTGIPGYCRFTIALEESEFQKALDCIAEFKRIVRL
ncbi:methionine S-methyltransferase-like isoform X1 [Cucurbita pepo subsp. pepo]|uniref:methionine S-methyltransferase-like isoform X1 n=1 Tax=Cucurbita pepo subsp. pepo TaxID=3664 RepID=UPI000C9D551D|nr:methionine S-methyltransferase-like isoform X1 [Cucurbita pepo subsp. pepo]